MPRVAKQGVFSLCFHPHGWINNTQIVELIDYAQSRYGGKVKFLSFRDVAERLTKNLLGGHPLRNATGGDNGVRVLDVDNDGYMDVVIANDQTQTTRLWIPASRQWRETPFPVPLVTRQRPGSFCPTRVFDSVCCSRAVRRACLSMPNNGVCGISRAASGCRMRREEGMPLPPCPTCVAGRDQGVRLRDLDLDGICELIVANPEQQAVYRLSAARWEPLAVEPSQRPRDRRRGRTRRWPALRGSGRATVTVIWCSPMPSGARRTRSRRWIRGGRESCWTDHAPGSPRCR